MAGVLPAFLTGGLGVQISAEFGVEEGAMGLAFAAYFATASVSSATLGGVAERIGARAALLLAPLLSAALQLGIAVWARSYFALFFLLAIAGTSNALAQPAANLALARVIPAERQGFAFGLKQSAVPICTLLGGLAVPVFAVGVGWRWAFVAGAGLAVLASLAALFSPADDRDPSCRAEPTGQTVPPPRRARMVLALGIGCGAAAAGAMAAFLVATGVKAGLSEASSGVWLTVGSLSGLVVRLGSGFLADRYSVRPLRVVVVMLALGTPAFAALAVGVPWIHCVATPIAFGAGWAWPGLFNLAVVRAYPDAPARATGVTQTGTYIGAVIGPLVFGIMAERSYFLAWMGATAMMIAAALAMHVADRSLEAGA